MADDASNTGPPAIVPGSTGQRPINVLLVEDNEVDVLSIRRAFKRADLPHGLTVVETAGHAMRVLRDEDDKLVLPRERRLVLLDLNLPDQGGLDLLRELRGDSDLGRTAVVVLTSSDEDRDKVEAFNLHVAGYLIKPVAQDDFLRLVAAINDYWSTSELPGD